MSERNRIVWVEDDLYSVQHYIAAFEDEGFKVHYVRTCARAAELTRKYRNEIIAIITDIMFREEGPKAGHEFARRMKRAFPEIHLFGFSNSTDPDVIDWFREYASDYISKSTLNPYPFLRAVRRKISPLADRRKYVRSFIVHGHDKRTKSELEEFLQNSLGLPRPITLHEQPSKGKTIIEKFEEEAENVDLIFVLLTPDEVGKHPRENVIFECGYFMGKFQRRTGRVFLLYKQPLELPSDLSGVVYIDISNGINEAGKIIERELSYII